MSWIRFFSSWQESFSVSSAVLTARPGPLYVSGPSAAAVSAAGNLRHWLQQLFWLEEQWVLMNAKSEQVDSGWCVGEGKMAAGVDNFILNTFDDRSPK